MKEVRKSTKDCTEFNTQNADAIAAGFMEAITPAADILQSEAKYAAIKQQEEEEAAFAKAIFRKLGSTDNNTVKGVYVSIEKTYSGGSSWSRGRHSGWKLVMRASMYARGDNKKWIVVGKGTDLHLTAKQEVLALAKIADLAEDVADANKQRNAEAEATARYKELVSTPEGKAFVGMVTQCSWVSEYGMDKFTVREDGSIRYGYETFTKEQWTKICALRKVHALEMKNLKDKYAQDNKPAEAAAK